jgi:hypothetical protein
LPALALVAESAVAESVVAVAEPVGPELVGSEQVEPGGLVVGVGVAPPEIVHTIFQLKESR